jgi:hypothetical protein
MDGLPVEITWRFLAKGMQPSAYGPSTLGQIAELKQ